MGTEAQRVCGFIARYAALLLEGGTSTDLTMEVLERLAAAYGFSMEASFFPMHVLVSVTDKTNANTFSINQKIESSGLNFARNTRLADLSITIAEKKLSLNEATTRMEMVVAKKRLPIWIVTLLASAANASFCRLFGGDWVAMAVILVATGYGFTLKHLLTKYAKTDLRVATVAAACLSSVIASACYIFHWGKTPDIALATSVLYLIPGIPYVNAIGDMLSGHHICSVSRFFNAAILTVCLSVGLCCGLLIMQFNIR